jgi:hypothetical protein
VTNTSPKIASWIAAASSGSLNSIPRDDSVHSFWSIAKETPPATLA